MKYKVRSLVIFMVCSLALAIGAACDKSSQPAAQDSSQPTATGTKHYQLKGKVVSVDKQAHMVNVDSEAIPGFMGAMTMPYPVKPESELNKLQPGNAITADLLVQDGSAWLQNIDVAPSSTGEKK